ncbi:hypothetical protein DPSP01_009306 [Paraphaeosphaeria sporulosa]
MMETACATCTGLQQHLEKPHQDHESEPPNCVRWVNTTLPHLRASSGGCRSCALLLQGILLHHGRFASIKEDRIRVTAETLHSTTNASQDHLSVELQWNSHEDDCDEMSDHEHEECYPDLKLEFFTDQDGQSSFSAIGRGRHIIQNPLQDTGIKTVNNMIRQCKGNHSLCRDSNPDFTPHRLLDLSVADPSKGICLRESGDDANAEQAAHEYFALSYRWGIGRGMPQTTSKTLKAYKKNIAWDTLPRAFQEAVLLTKSLGVRFLWIDSLCIVQDDPSDRLRASLELNDTYGNASLTIASTSAVEPTKGLFAPKMETFKVQVNDSKGSLSKVYVREQPSHYSFKKASDAGLPMNNWELLSDASREANARTPLLLRAWAYAERLLSSRVLHFTDSEMLLECREAFQCECGRIDDAVFDPRKTDTVKQDFAQCAALSDTNGHRRMDSVVSQLAATSLSDGTDDLSTALANPLELWSYIVTEYTSRNITYDTDRLMAIAGVAKTLSRAISTGYIAGHWMSSTLGLLWYPNEGAQCRRPKQVAGRYVPSWSWASVEGSPIFFDNSSAMDLACSASFSINGSQNIFSPFSGDAVELRAAMATEVVFKEDAPGEYSLSRNGISVEFQPDIVPLRGEDTIKSGETLVCVLVSMSFRSSILGLILRKSRTKAPTYRRIGRFECYECLQDRSDEEPEDAEALFEHWFPDVDDMTQLDERPRHVFKIV